jgi:uncharacterized protein
MELSAAEARRLAIAAQGLAARRPKRPGSEDLLAMVQRLGVVQLDSVNVLARSHYLVGFARVGAYDLGAFDRLSHEAPRSVFEYWGHEASLLPIELQPAFRWRMARAKDDAWGRMRKIAKKRALVDKVLAAIAEAERPVRAGELETRTKPKTQRGWWAWSEAKTVIEWLFWSGQVTSAARKQFERHYDLPHRVLPPEILAIEHADEVAQRLLIERAARAVGVGTEADLRDYYRFPLADARAAIKALVEDGTLVPATVEGWKKAAYVHRDTPAPPKTVAAQALLSPFDSLIWFRERTHRMWGMQFRLEVYTPAPKRVHGYYVLPFLLGDALVARVDLKADRAGSTLRVLASHEEPGVKAASIVEPLHAELRAMADWMGLEHVAVEKRGDLAPALRTKKKRK